MPSDVDEFDDDEIDSVVGEYREGRQLYYFVKYSDGIAYKRLAVKFRMRHPVFVERYEQKKAKGTLLPFDPSATYVHYHSRVRLPVKLKGKETRRRRERSNSDELAMSIPSDDSDDNVRRSNVKRVTRAAAGTSTNNARPLPFSPKKMPSIKSYFLPDSDEFDSTDSEVQEVPQPTRRSTRSKKTVRTNLDDNDFVDDADGVDSDEFDDEDSSYSKPKAPKQKKIVRGKASRPAYGRFRVIADMELDEQEDPDTAPLRAHRKTCEKCHKKPAHQLLLDARKPKKGRKKKKGSDEEVEDDEQRLTALGGWVRCLKCPVAAHWGCLAKTQRDEILKAALDRDKAEWQAAQTAQNQPGESANPAKAPLEPMKRPNLTPYQTTEFICGSCMKGGVCMSCKEVAIRADDVLHPKPKQNGVPVGRADEGDIEMADATADAPTTSTAGAEDPDPDTPAELVFRCVTCKRIAHYAHLPVPPDHDDSPEDVSAVQLAEHYQENNHWQCADCISYVYTVDHILAWRPYPENAVEPVREAGEPINHKQMLPREYLIKWTDRSYRRTSWVPHGWLLATNTARLRNFLQSGSKVPLLPEAPSEGQVEGDESDAIPFLVGGETENDASAQLQTNETSALQPNPDAERKIPPAWKTTDRVLDVLFWYPEKRVHNKSKKKHQRRSNARRDESDEEGDPEKAAVEKEHQAVYTAGEQPSDDLTETIDNYTDRTRRSLRIEDIDRVVWVFTKWDGLGYEDASWDSPPLQGEAGYTAFQNAFERFVAAQELHVPKLSSAEAKAFDGRPQNAWRKKWAFTVEEQPQLGQSPQLKLMPFQVDGVNWLCDNWWNHQNCILADEMGLGKTVQIATFIGHTVGHHQANPVLVVVPNSTITNWVREFERWAPELRVVPFYGEAKARDIIKRYELFHHHQKPRTTGAKFHVLVTTYEMITNPREFTPVFKNVPRWEILVVDEGQRLKSDDSMIFKKLKELNTIHRVIMTGTPLNNNIRELFTLMNFLDPGGWSDLDALAKEYEELSEDSIKELHARLKPYFLRRIKSEVLQLPPKNEVIVPVSMSPLQREVYRSILSQNLGVLRNLVERSVGSSVSAAVSKSNMNNILMQLRKCLQHPYLVSEEIEPKGLSNEEAHAKLIDASSKMGLLKSLLPKLRERGHRVLLFSQFAIALNIIEDFLIGEGDKYLRLDGSTKQADRQKGMDEFNKPGSDVFIYLLTTRAGGVGINLWTADTVIIFDPDFNPHQDLQAIARAHRYGQKKTCLVFKLMVKGSAEDKIMQTGKKKLVLDHLIVQKMDDEEGSKEDVQSILMFGAQALFEDEQDVEKRQIHYSDHDIDKLIERTEKEGDEVESTSASGNTFSFAKVWSADKDSLEEIPEEGPDTADQVDSWAQTLERIAAERTKVQAQETTGRGARRRAAAVFPQQNTQLDDGVDEDKGKSQTQDKPKRRGRKKQSKSQVSDDSDVYAGPESGASDSEGSSTGHATSMLAEDLATIAPAMSSSPKAQSTKIAVGRPRSPKPSSSKHFSPSSANTLKNLPQPFSPVLNTVDPPCGLCGGQHGGEQCYMTNSPENLAEYRLMLILHAGDEPLEDRRAAIQAIDEALYKRGMIHLIYGQPLHLVEHPLKDQDPPPRKRSKQEGSNGSSLSLSTVRKTNGRPGSAQAGGSKMTAAPLLRPQGIPSPAFPVADNAQNLYKTSASNPTASSSKRPVSPSANLPTKKKKINDNDPVCVVCGQSPHHLVKDCPLVMEGPKAVKMAIDRLAGDSAHEATIRILTKIYTKQQRRALATSGPGVIDLSK